MYRRDFIKTTTSTATMMALGGMALESCTAQRPKQITILHTNDVHSHIDPFPKDHSAFPGLGGLARRASLVQQIRATNENTLLFDAGDIFQGTPYFNFYGGELEFKLMSMLKYDAATIGNHDFDNGLGGLLAQMPHAQFDMLSANYDFSKTPLDGFTKPYRVYERDGIKVGVYGLGIKLQGLVTQTLYGETQYMDPLEMAQETERTLNEQERCDLIICLSHLGYQYKDPQRPDDLKLAGATQHTDLIIGGHTHTFLERPTVVPNAQGRDILVNQVGCFGVYLGRVDFYFDAAGGQAKGYTIKV